MFTSHPLDAVEQCRTLTGEDRATIVQVSGKGFVFLSAHAKLPREVESALLAVDHVPAS